MLVRGGIQYAILLDLGAFSLLPGPLPVSATIMAPLSPNSSSSSPGSADVSTRKYQSQPALFGMQLEHDASYDTILQAIPDDPHLCAGKTSSDEQRGASTSDATEKKQREEGKNLYGYPNTNTDANMIFLPQRGETVALLAKRGVCSFEDKARTALAVDAKLRHRLRRKRRSKNDASGRHNESKSDTENYDTPLIQFVVVYDDIHRPALVPMSASDDDDIDDIGLVFISSDAGDELLALVESDAESNSEYRDGGVPITIDATAPWGGYGYTYHYGLYGEDYPREFILAAMAGFFMCLALLGCLLLCAQAGIISTDGSLVVFGRTLADEIMARQTAARRERPRLLTEEQVLALPVVQYCASASAVDATPRMNRTESMPPPVTTAHSPLERRSASSLDYRARNAFNVCDICIEEYVDGEVLTELPCGHRYHVECILPWLTKRSSLCPHCRADVWDADPYTAAASEAFATPSSSTPLVGPDRTTADTYGSTSFGDYSPLRYLRDAWQSSASLSGEIDVGIGARHEFSDSDTEDANTSRVQTTRLMSDSLGN